MTSIFLKQHDDLCVLSADKGNRTVIMTKTDYHQKMETLINDDQTYRSVNRDPTGPAQTKNNNFVKRLFDLKLINKKTAQHLTIYNSTCPRIYGQPKAHKANIPLRPVIPNTNAPTYKISKFLANILQQSIASKYNISSSFDFCDKINKTILPEQYVIASLDVTSLFTNIPRSLVTSNIIKKWNTINSQINLDLFLEMINFCMEASFFQYKNKFYIQTYGTAMGSPLSPILADIVLESIIERAIAELPFDIPVIYKYVDDLFIAYPRDMSQDVLAAFNQQEQRLQFTIEYENNGKLPYLDMLVMRNDNQQLSTEWYAKPIASGRMLNYFSFHQMKHKLNTAENFIHRVSTLSPRSSYEQRKTIISTQLLLNNYPKTLINRLLNKYQQKAHQQSMNYVVDTQDGASYHINTSESTINTTSAHHHNHNNAANIVNQLTPNIIAAGASSSRHPLPQMDYHNTQITRSINIAGASSSQPPCTTSSQLNNCAPNEPPITEHLNDQNSPVYQQTPRIYLPLLYIPTLTDHLIKLLRKSYPNICIATRQYKTISILHTKVKDPVNKLDKSNIVYKINCGQCSSSYVGKSKNKLSTRLSGHRSNVNKLEQVISNNTNTPTKMNELRQKTALMEHCIETEHRFDFTNALILDQSFYSHTLDFLEMCYIKTNTSTINKRTDVDNLNTAYAGILDRLANIT